jgi:enoyl-CoA hydratase/carnithine racemase
VTTTELISVSQAGKVLRLRMNRPDKKNALNRVMYLTLAEEIERADRDPDIRVITLSGTGDAFSSGNDVADFLDGRPMDADNPAVRFLFAISQARKPLLAGVNGLAVGIGVTMLLHCDLVYATEEATFQLPFVNLALVPEAASSLLLPRLIGHHRAAELLFLGNKFNAQVAREMGLVNAIHTKGSLAGAIEGIATALAAKPPASLQLTKELMKGEAFKDAVLGRIKEETACVNRQLRSDEAREAMEAFLQKRAPDFSRFA